MNELEKENNDETLDYGVDDGIQNNTQDNESKDIESQSNKKTITKKRKFKLSSSSCSICLLDFSVGDKVVCSDNCNHNFHLNCMLPWLLKHHKTCPNCRCDFLNLGGRGKGFSRVSYNALFRDRN